MYLISYDNKNYLNIHRYKSRKEAEEALKYNILNLIYSYCYNEVPLSAILKNNQFKNFLYENQKLLSIIKSNIDNIENIENIHSLQILSDLVRDFLIIQNHYNNTPLEYNAKELVRLAKAGKAKELLK